jgi:hypothetical protein
VAYRIKDERAPEGRVPITNVRFDFELYQRLNRGYWKLKKSKQQMMREAIVAYLDAHGVPIQGDPDPQPPKGNRYKRAKQQLRSV